VLSPKVAVLIVVGILIKSTVFFTHLDHSSEMIIFESILTTLIMSVVFKGRWGSDKIKQA
jgi:hypothetical protein